jgi:hypothetical protein
LTNIGERRRLRIMFGIAGGTGAILLLDRRRVVAW